MFEGTFARSGTLKEPFVTTHELTTNAALMQVPDPEKVPVALVLVSAETVIEPVVREQLLASDWTLPLCPMRRAISLHVLVAVWTQFTSMLKVPVVCPLTVMTAKSDVVLVLGMFAAMFVLLSVASLNPAAQVVA